MKIRTKLILAFSVVTLINLAVGTLGFLQTRALSSALLEIGTVRMPSIDALNRIKDAMVELDSMGRGTTVKDIDKERAAAWRRFEEGWKTYEPLPQTSEEMEKWKTFGASVEVWKSDYARIATGLGDGASFLQAVNALNEVMAVNNQIARENALRTIASIEDAERVQRTMILAALLALAGAIGAGVALGRTIRKPMEEVALALSRISRGDLQGRIHVTSQDEVGDVARATNQMAEALSRSEAERKQAEESLRQSHAQLRALTGKLEMVREEERTRIAREIHDSLAQELTRLRIDLGLLQRRIASGGLDTQALIEKSGSLLETTDIAIGAMQKISAELRPMVLDSLGLEAAIEWQAEEFERESETQCDVILPEDEEFELSREMATNVFRIVQEGLKNVQRHARATHVDIILEHDERELRLMIQDNGTGFDEQKLAPESLGLLGMRERAAMLEGKFEIQGKPGKGTQITVTFPIKKEKSGSAS